MRKPDAQQLLNSFIGLEGTKSKFYKQEIKKVFVGFEDYGLSEIMVRQKQYFSSEMPSEGLDNKYTICVALLDDKTVVSAKMLVEKDNLTNLAQQAQKLDYIEQVKNDGTDGKERIVINV